MKLQSHLHYSLTLFRYQAQLCISSQLMSLGRVYTASLPWTLKKNLFQWKNGFAVINGNADHDKNWWCLFCLTGILFLVPSTPGFWMKHNLLRFLARVSLNYVWFSSSATKPQSRSTTHQASLPSSRFLYSLLFHLRCFFKSSCCSVSL